MSKIRPPAKLSELLRMAIRDGRTLDQAKYEPKSKVWHYPTEEGLCEICLAGAVLAGTLRFNQDVRVRSADQLPDGWDRAARALEFARQSRWHFAVEELTGTTVDHETWTKLQGIPRNKHGRFQSWDGFVKHLKELAGVAQELEQHGL